MTSTTRCPVCGGGTFGFQSILPPRLVADWALFTRAHPAAHAIAAFPYRPVFPDAPGI